MRVAACQGWFKGCLIARLSLHLYRPCGLWSGRGPAEAGVRVAMSKILLAEDNMDIRRFLVKALQNAGFERRVLRQRPIRLPAPAAEPFELLLTDIVMPEMDGIELARRATKLDPDIKIMFITGFAAVALKFQFQRAQARQGAVEADPSSRTGQRGVESCSRPSILVEHDLFGKPVSILQIKSKDKLFRIMLWGARDMPCRTSRGCPWRR